MRRYNIIINRVRKIIVTVNQFPRDKTLTFFHHSSIRILAHIIMKLKAEVEFAQSVLFEIDERFVKIALPLRLNVKPITLTVDANPSSIEKEDLTLPVKFIFTWGLALRSFVEFYDRFTFKMLMEPIVGRFRKLGEMDNVELGHWDDMTLGEVDFITL